MAQLNKAQRETIGNLCKYRHMIHSKQVDFQNHKQFNLLKEEIGVGTKSKINKKLLSVGLSQILFMTQFEHSDESVLCNKEHTPYFREKEFKNFLEELNTAIEEYLGQIDSVYGTHYTPSGFSRMLLGAQRAIQDKKKEIGRYFRW